MISNINYRSLQQNIKKPKCIFFLCFINENNIKTISTGSLQQNLKTYTLNFFYFNSLIIQVQIFKPIWFRPPTFTQKLFLKPNKKTFKSLMKLDEFAKAGSFQLQQQAFYESLTLTQIVQTNPQDILKIILEKDRIIQAFSQQITKFKAEQLKTKKLIASLQQKIQKILPSGTNTSSSFMIPSQFKALFTAFMTSTVPSVFYDFTQHPKLYALLLRNIMEGVYQKLFMILQKKIEEIRKILIESSNHNFDETKIAEIQKSNQDESLRQQIRFHLLNFLQKYCKQIFPCNLSQTSQNLSKNQDELDDNINSIKTFLRIEILSESSINEEILQKIETLNSEQTQKTEEMKQFFMELYQICLYMILQQNPWEFVYDTQIQQVSKSSPNEAKLIYTKKEFTCIDGFVKEGSKVEMVMKGLKRRQNSEKEYHFHPNIKNFVLPLNNDQEEESYNFKFKTQVFFLNGQKITHKKFQSQGQSQNSIMLKDITNNSKDYQQNLVNPPILPKTLTFIIKAPVNKSLKIKQNDMQSKKPKIISQSSFKIEAVAETEKSQIIESMLVQRQQPLIQNESNCIIESTESYTLLKRSHSESKFDDHENKENVSENVNMIKPDKKLSTNSKKDKSLAQKNMKKGKKQKNNSTIDLTSQKHKTNKKENLKEQNDTDLHKKKHDELPLAKEVPKSSKKKEKGNSSRKCSVGKIVSQSAQMIGSSIHGKQKISLSQHATVMMKQPSHTKALKENYIHEGSQRFNVENKENLMNFVGHMYEKQIIRPKKSAKISKNDDKPLVLGVSQAQKQERPLALRTYQNNCLVGKLREKYLIG